MRVRKTVLAVGEHQSPEGVVRATPERLRHWSEQFRKMQAAGLKVPVCWGHQARAVPLDPADPHEAQYLSSRYNAGYVTGLTATPDGQLVAEKDAPGLTVDGGNLVAWTKLADGREVKSAVGEVSVGIARKFKDGKGRVWDDVITHVAVTPHPVWAGQDGFQALSLDAALAGRAEGVVTLALGGSGMADALDDLDLDDEPETPAEPPPSPTPPSDPSEVNLDKLLPALAEHGIQLPEGTDDKNFTERLYVAIIALQGKLTPVGAGPDPAAEQTPAVAEEPDAVMMSLLANPALSKEQKAALERLRTEATEARDRERRRKAERVRRKLEKYAGGGLPREVLARHFGSEPATVCLSLHERPAAELAAYDAMLALLDDLAPHLVTRDLTRRTAGAHEVPNPSARQPDEEQQKVTRQMAHMATGREPAAAK